MALKSMKDAKVLKLAVQEQKLILGHPGITKIYSLLCMLLLMMSLFVMAFVGKWLMESEQKVQAPRL